MSSVTFSTSVGGDNSTVTDDASAITGLANGGHRSRFVSALAQVVAVAGHVVTKAGEADSDASAASGSASAASGSASAASASALAASGSADGASASALAASGSAATASSAATTALNAPGTSATSTTGLTIAVGAQSLTIQTGKSIVVGMSVVIAATSTPTDRMSGVVTAYNSGTGTLSVQVDAASGVGNSYASWTVSLGNAMPAAATQAEMEAGTEASLRSVSPLRVKQAIAAIASMPGHTHTGTYEPVQTAATQAEMVGGTVSAVRSMSPLRIKQAMVVGYVARTANTMLAAGDLGKFIDITSGTFTQTFDAAATLGAGWWCYIRNVGTGVITLDPNASETIDGVTSGVIVAGDTYLVICTGTAFITERRQNGPMCIELKTSSGNWVAPLGVRKARVTVVGGGGGGASGTNYTGSGGGTAIKTFTVQPGTSYSYVVGAAGATNYGSGGDSSFTGSTTITGSGGTSTYTAAVGGAASGGDVNIPGGPAAVYSGDHLISGDSMYGFGAIGASNNRPASGYGGGGGAWQNGTQGCVIIEY